MSDRLLVLNAGSSSIKFAVYAVDGDSLARQIKGQIENIGGAARFHAGSCREDIAAADHAEALSWLTGWLERQSEAGRLLAVGHRVTHGGAAYAEPVLVTDQVLEDLRGLISLAPLHQPHNISGIDAVRRGSGLPSVACFDTAFHVTQGELVKRFALPRAFYDEGVRRYGFHGLSYDYIAHHLAREMPDLHRGRVLVAHLGNGASLCAMEAGRCVETSMGFSALDGLCMGTRCGRLDPGVLLYMVQSRQMDGAMLEDLLYRQSGLLGLSGISHDMRTLVDSPAAEAQMAVAYFIHHLNREVGALVATMGGIDALVFTGGIGENSRVVRAGFADRAGWLGVRVSAAANEANDTLISTPESKIPVLVIPTDEEHMIARQTLAVLQGRSQD